MFPLAALIWLSQLCGYNKVVNVVTLLTCILNVHGLDFCQDSDSSVGSHGFIQPLLFDVGIVNKECG
jgi:hypothetical protein